MTHIDPDRIRASGENDTCEGQAAVAFKGESNFSVVRVNRHGQLAIGEANAQLRARSRTSLRGTAFSVTSRSPGGFLKDMRERAWGRLRRWSPRLSRPGADCDITQRGCAVSSNRQV